MSWDVAIIGGGVVGTAIARELAGYELRCVLLEAADDIGTGTSKANTAILHTGFDATPGSLESRLVARGGALLRDYAQRAGIAVERTGALLVAWTRGPIRWRLDFATGHRRAVVWKVAHTIAALAPELVNDPTETTWDVVLVEDDDRALELVPRRAHDPRFTWRRADVPYSTAAGGNPLAQFLFRSSLLEALRRNDIEGRDPFSRQRA